MKPAPWSHDARSLRVEPSGDQEFNLIFEENPEVNAALMGKVLGLGGKYKLEFPTEVYPHGFIKNLTEDEAREAIKKIGRNNYHDPRGILPLNE